MRQFVRPVVSTGTAAAVYVVLVGAVGPEPLLVAPFTLHLGAVLATTAGVLAGPAGALGIALGAVLAGGLRPAVAFVDLATPAVLLVVGVVAHRTWLGFGVSRRAGGAVGRRHVVAAVTTASVATVLLGALVGWGDEVTRRSEFVVAVVDVVVYSSPSIVLAAAVIALGSSRPGRSRRAAEYGREGEFTARTAATPSLRSSLALFVPVAWVLLGVGVGLFFHAVSVVSEAAFAIHGLDWFLLVRNEDLLGPAESTAQIGLGVLAMTTLAVTLARANRSNDDVTGRPDSDRGSGVG